MRRLRSCMKSQGRDSDTMASAKGKGLMDVALGLQYSGGQEDLYREFLAAFCDMQEAKRRQVEDAFSAGHWKEYTDFVHSLKSTSLTVGGRQLSEAAKGLEMAGKEYLASGEEAQLRYLQDRHGEAMALWDAFTAEAREWLKK